MQSTIKGVGEKKAQCHIKKLAANTGRGRGAEATAPGGAGCTYTAFETSVGLLPEEAVPAQGCAGYADAVPVVHQGPALLLCSLAH